MCRRYASDVAAPFPVALPDCCLLFFFFNAPAPTEIYTLSLHDALPISPLHLPHPVAHRSPPGDRSVSARGKSADDRRRLCADRHPLPGGTAVGVRAANGNSGDAEPGFGRCRLPGNPLAKGRTGSGRERAAASLEPVRPGGGAVARCSATRGPPPGHRNRIPPATRTGLDFRDGLPLFPCTSLGLFLPARFAVRRSGLSLRVGRLGVLRLSRLLCRLSIGARRGPFSTAPSGPAATRLGGKSPGRRAHGHRPPPDSHGGTSGDASAQRRGRRHLFSLRARLRRKRQETETPRALAPRRRPHAGSLRRPAPAARRGAPAHDGALFALRLLRARASVRARRRFDSPGGTERHALLLRILRKRARDRGLSRA